MFNGEALNFFDLFQQQEAQEPGGMAFSDFFWSMSILRESLADQCTGNSLAAILSLSLALTCPPDAGNPLPFASATPDGGGGSARAGAMPLSQLVHNEHHERAIDHHTHAVNMFRERLHRQCNTTTPRAILISTPLFVSYELLQGNTSRANAFILDGVTLLQERLGDPAFVIDGEVRYMMTTLSELATHASLAPFCQRIFGQVETFDGGLGDGLVNEDGLVDERRDLPALEAPLHHLQNQWADYATKTTSWAACHYWLGLTAMPTHRESACVTGRAFRRDLNLWRMALHERSDRIEKAARLAGRHDTWMADPEVRELFLLRMHVALCLRFVEGCLEGTTEPPAVLDRWVPDAVPGGAGGGRGWRSPGQHMRDMLERSIVPIMGFTVYFTDRPGVEAEVEVQQGQLEWVGPLGAYGIEKVVLDVLEAVGNVKRDWVEETKQFHPLRNRYMWARPEYYADRRKVLVEFSRMVGDKMGQTVGVKMTLDI